MTNSSKLSQSFSFSYQNYFTHFLTLQCSPHISPLSSIGRYLYGHLATFSTEAFYLSVLNNSNMASAFRLIDTNPCHSTNGPENMQLKDLSKHVIFVFILYKSCSCWNSSVSTVTGFFLYSTASAAHPPSNDGFEGLFPQRKVARAWSWPLTFIQCLSQGW
jgi:hypothetical protein